MRVGVAPRVLKPAAYLALLFPKIKSSAEEYLFCNVLLHGPAFKSQPKAA